MKRKEINLLDTKISVSNMNHTLEEIKDMINCKRKSYICCAPVSTVVQARRDKEYCDVINKADMVLPDGMPLVWFLKFHGETEVGRVCGIDLMEYICSDPKLTNWNHFFLGTTESTLFLLKRQLYSFNPEIKIVGTMSLPFRDKAELEPQWLIDKINWAKPDILWVALGSPKQDFWMSLHRSRLDVPVMIGVGAAFDFLSGVKTRAPKWMQHSGLEWLFRLFCEPRRLWKRYLILNLQFCYEIIFYLTKNKKEKRSK
jgi:N-acetylglucosaminyldiphosphoundecaprenol N-acetyl-beta-D-mannosaminyltransferase